VRGQLTKNLAMPRYRALVHTPGGRGLIVPSENSIVASNSGFATQVGWGVQNMQKVPLRNFCNFNNLDF
jgi:hypothetical protein